MLEKIRIALDGSKIGINNLISTYHHDTNVTSAMKVSIDNIERIVEELSIDINTLKENQKNYYMDKGLNIPAYNLV